MGVNIGVKVAATGVIALCLVLAFLSFLFGSSFDNSTMYSAGNTFVTLAIALIAIFIIAAAMGVKIRFG